MELDHFGGLFAPGYTLSVEERAALEVQMAKKRLDERLHRSVAAVSRPSRRLNAVPLRVAGSHRGCLRPSHLPRRCSVRFWGRVQGTTADYLVVAGVLSSAEFPVRKYFFATTRDLSLQQLPEVTPEFAAQAAAPAVASQRFVGNPAKLLGADAEAGEDEGEEELDEEGNPKPRKPRFNEAVRLAAAVATIERECGAVPKGAYAVTATRHVVPNAAFAGLSASEATSLGAWQHFRQPEHPARAAVLAKASAVPGCDDFLDPLSEDVPAGVWAAQLDAGRAIARVASLKWPGFFGFCTVDGTGRWGSVYVGDGRAAEIQFSL